jgi:hypothetical protein
VNDAEYRATKKRLAVLIEKWRITLYLGNWQIDTTYFRETPEDMCGSGGYAPLMDVEPRWEYLKAIIRFNMPMLVSLSDDDLERSIVHELLHCAVCEMREMASHPADSDEARRHEERVVSQLTKAIISTEIRGWNDGKADLRKKQKAEAAQGG